MSKQDLLFGKHELRLVIEAHRDAVCKEVMGIEPDGFLNTSADDLANYLFEKFQLEVPVLQESDITVEQEETQVDVSGDQMRFISDRSRPFYIPGTEVRYFIPFTGDPDLFFCRASTSSWNPPHGKVNRDQTLVLSYTATGHDAAGIKSQFDSELGKIRQHLDWARSDVAQFNSELPTLAKEAIEWRRQKLLNDRGLVASLGFPLRERPGATRTYATPPYGGNSQPAPPLPRRHPSFQNRSSGWKSTSTSYRSCAG
jgi:hypothetical protein